MYQSLTYTYLDCLLGVKMRGHKMAEIWEWLLMVSTADQYQDRPAGLLLWFVLVCRVMPTDLNYWIKLLSCIIEANGGHIGLSHINLHWYYWGSRRGFYRFRLLVGMDKHCVNEISFTNNFCFFLNLPVNNELGIVQDGRHEFIIKCFKPSQNH